MSDRTIPTVVFLAGWLSAIGAAVGDENSPPAGPKPRPEVIAALQELAKLPHDERRKQFTETIAQLPPDPVPGDPSRAKQLLVAAIKKFDDDAQGALSFAPPEKTAPLLIEALADPDKSVRSYVASTIGRSLRSAEYSGRTDGPKLFAAAIPILAGEVASSDRSRQANSQTALEAMGESGILPILNGYLRSGLPYMNERRIADYSDLIVPELLKALDDPGCSKTAALNLLQLVVKHDARILPAIIRELDAPDRAVRIAAARAAASYGAAAEPARERLLRMFTDSSDREEADAALWALTAVGLKLDQVDVLLTKIDRPGSIGTNDRERWLRQFGYTIATPGRAVVPRLIAALASDDKNTRTAAVYACSRLGPLAADAAVPLAELYARRGQAEAEYMGQAHVLEALGQMGSAALPAADKLIAVLESARFVGAMRHRKYLPEDAIPILSDTPARALAQFGPAVVPRLYRGLSGDKPTMRVGCAEALSLMPTEEAPEAAARLFAQFDRETDEHVQVHLIRALVALDADKAELRRRLEPYLGEARPAASGKTGRYLPIAAAIVLDDARAQVRTFPTGGFFGRPGLQYGRKFYADLPQETFSWGAPVAGLQIGAALPPRKIDDKGYATDLQRVILAVRNVGDRPIWLPTDSGQTLLAPEFVFPDHPEIVLQRDGRYTDRYGVTELRPGQMIIRGVLGGVDPNFGRYDDRGRWIRFRPEDRSYRLVVKLTGIDRPDPPHRLCLIPAAIRRECWSGDIVSGEIEARFDSPFVRKSKEAAAEQK